MPLAAFAIAGAGVCWNAHRAGDRAVCRWGFGSRWFRSGSRRRRRCRGLFSRGLAVGFGVWSWSWV